MKLVTAKLKGVSPLSMSRHYLRDTQEGESADDSYRRTWRNHMHFDPSGRVFLPPNMCKNALEFAAKFKSISIPGKGKQKYTKHFTAGVIVTEPSFIGVNKDDVEMEALFLPSDGRRGGSKRVMKYFPFIPEWEASVQFIVIDETVLHTMPNSRTRLVFQEVLEECGRLVGYGRFRPINGGYYGRFEVTDFAVS